MTCSPFPLIFEVYKPEERLEPGDVYRSKPQIAAQMIRDLRAMRFKFKLVLADCLYGQSESNFISVLDELDLEYAVAIRSDYGVWLPQGQRVRYNRWRDLSGFSLMARRRNVIFAKLFLVNEAPLNIGKSQPTHLPCPRILLGM